LPPTSPTSWACVPPRGPGKWWKTRPTRPRSPPAEAAQRLPADAWQRTVQYDRHGTQLIRYVAALELGASDGPTTGVRLVAATLDPAMLKPESTWYLATSLPLGEARPEPVYALYRLREWIEHCYKPAKHALGWADYQLRPERAIVRHWQLVLLAYTFSRLVGAIPTAPTPATDPSPTPAATGGGNIRPRPSPRVRGAGRLERHAAAHPQLALPLGTATAVVDALVARRPTARVGRAPRPRRALPPA
jgi:hypothetical protein